jgi:hypothetical protein
MIRKGDATMLQRFGEPKILITNTWNGNSKKEDQANSINTVSAKHGQSRPETVVDST